MTTSEELIADANFKCLTRHPGFHGPTITERLELKAATELEAAQQRIAELEESNRRLVQTLKTCGPQP